MFKSENSWEKLKKRNNLDRNKQRTSRNTYNCNSEKG